MPSYEQSVADAIALRQELIIISDGDPNKLIDLVTIKCMEVIRNNQSIAEVDSEMEEGLMRALSDGIISGYECAEECILETFRPPHPDWKPFTDLNLYK